MNYSSDQRKDWWVLHGLDGVFLGFVDQESIQCSSKYCESFLEYQIDHHEEYLVNSGTYWVEERLEGLSERWENQNAVLLKSVEGNLHLAYVGKIPKLQGVYLALGSTVHFVCRVHN